MWLLNPYRFGDPDAAAYIAAVEAADGQVLEGGVASAITAFVVGCKADGIWDAIKASCIMAGARTLTGALVPLVGPAPTNLNFVAGDYDRKTGLKGNGSTKYLDSNYLASNLGIDNHHVSVYKSNQETLTDVVVYIGATIPTLLTVLSISKFYSSEFLCSSSNAGDTIGGISTGFSGISRSNSLSYQGKTGTTIANIPRASVYQASTTFHVFAIPNSNIYRTNARLSFYSIGEAIDLALLDARVTALMNALAAAIP